MPSPFPGMDPYLEGDLWQEFHDRLANQISSLLLPQLQPKYVALLSKRYVFDRPALGVLDLPPEQRVIYPDAHIVQVKEAVPAHTGTMAPTVEVNSPMAEEVPILSVEIRDVAQRRLVTIIEILSPVNKRGDGAREYVQRRDELLKTRTHLLEIDLIRRGGRIPFENPLPPAPYYVFLSRFDRRPVTEVWAIALRHALPTVPVPLLPPDEDVVLTLQTAVDACFDLVGYERLLDYQQPPPPPAFSTEDTDWINGRIAAATKGAEARIGE
ncbi:MAG: DUF4058 family protein [Chloroflexota bacterium]